MKLNNLIYTTLFIYLAFFASCQNDALNAGASALDREDEIRVESDTFSVLSSLQKCSALQLTPDSFLLGECDTHFGTIKADILTQLACPEGYEYPYSDKAEVDSVVLHLYYQNWYGDGKSPLGISVYEIDKSTLQYDSRYPSDTTISTFCSLTDSTRISEHSHITFAGVPTDSVYSSDNLYIPRISIKLTDAFAKRFFAIKDFSSQETFNQLFKGLYIVSDFGGSTVLYVKDIYMSVYYHFPSHRQNQQDSIIHDVKTFYANSEVRQINRYIYPDRDQVLLELQQRTDTNYIISPANIYTRLSLQMDSVYQQIENQLGDTSTYRVYVNRANLTIDVLYSDSISSRPRDQWDSPAAYMLLVQENKMEDFFANNELPSDTLAILSSLVATTDTLGNISYYYSYDLSALLTKQLRSDNKQEELSFLLVPVAVDAESSSSSNITSVKPLQTISTTHIRSAQNSVQPMDLELIYSGFNK
ncbi:MAG: DUF4270 domain-containing protein [Paludibacteraceae bacterium]|nr:DUF4270 domain-containing protein [Paludibacteraceae bacterium]